MVRYLCPGVSISQIISKLETQYGTVDNMDILLQKVYGMNQEKNKEVQAFSTRLEGGIKQIIIRFPNMATEEEMERHLRDHLFYGVHKALWDNIHYLYDDKQITYTQLLMAARKAELEVLEGKGTTTLAKAKAANPQFDHSSSKVNELCQPVVNLMSIVKSTQTNSTMGQICKGLPISREGTSKEGRLGYKWANPSTGRATTSAHPFRGKQKQYQCCCCGGWGHPWRQCPSTTGWGRIKKANFPRQATIS